MRFTHPAGLVLLLLLPLVALLGWPGPGFDRRRELGALIVRLVIILILIMALAGFEAARPSNQLSVVYLLDASASMPAQARAAATEWIQRSLAKIGPEDRAAVVVFGQDALVERSMSSSRTLGPITSVPNPGGTDLSAAVRLGLALYPGETARRMVILSDGAVNREDPTLAARLAQASGVQIQAVPFQYESGPEVQVASIDAPSALRPQEQFDLWVTIRASQPSSAEVQVIANGSQVYSAQQEIHRGEQSFSLPLKAGEPGFTQYEVQVVPQKDTHPQNNSLSAFSIVLGPPQVLVVSETSDPASGEAQQLQEALKSSGLEVQPAHPGELPSQVGGLSQYSGVVLVDLPATQLSWRQMETLQSYVQDLGGGLVVVGGPQSYGVGGYFRTPLEETLPVEMQIKEEQRRPVITIVFIIDHSGSMAEKSGGEVKLELAKEAAIRSTELLFPNDRVGVVAFDETASWIVPITSLEDPQSVMNAIASLRPGGGTDILAGLQAVDNVLPQDPGKTRHVILLTDGGADPSGLPDLVAKMHSAGITLSTVGVGQDAAPFLANLAQLGGGRYHFTADASTIPSIFTSETSLATRAYIEEHPFVPQSASSSPVMAGIRTIPQLLGYIATTPKSSAQTVLVSDLGDPILSMWQYGLGRAAAFTSDATGRWAKAWTGWSGFPRFWSQLIGDTIRDETQGRTINLQVEPPREDAQFGFARLLVDLRDNAGEYQNGFQLSARVVPPDGQAQTTILQQTAPGRYEGEFTPSQTGAYLIALSAQPPEEGSDSERKKGLSKVTGWINPYPVEYNFQPPDPKLLETVADLTGGGIAPEDPGLVFRHDLPAPRATRPLWPWLLALAAILLPVDIGMRRLAIQKGDVQQAWSKVVNSIRPGTKVPRPSPERSARIEALLRLKQPAHRDPTIDGKGDIPSIRNIQEQSENVEADIDASSEEARVNPQVRKDQIESSHLSTTAHLLAKKRAGRGRDKP